MKKLVRVIALFFIAGTANAQIDYNPKMETIKGQEIICPADNKEANTYIPPPAFIQYALKNKLRLPTKANFIVTYKGFPPAAQRAFQDAVDIWAGLLTSSVPIRVNASWEKLADGVLGSASPADYTRNFDGTQKAFTWYPMAMAEKIAQRELNGSNPDITARFGSTINWYLSNAGAPGTGQFDFTSTVLHELGHGLGFTGSLRVASNSGSWGLGSGSPFIFDQYVENGSGQQLVSTTNFLNPSAKLAQELASDNLFFNSPIAAAKNGGSKPRLYSPTTYSAGSSTFHLNSETYPAGNINSLMTPSTSSREVIKDPGPIVMNMFTEMGWKGTSLLHTRFKDTEDKVNPIVFRTKIESDTSLIAGSAKLVYSINDTSAAKRITVNLARVGNTNEYNYSLPPTANDKLIRYYFEVKDNSGRTYTNPPQAPRYLWSFNVAVDNAAPTIDDLPIDLAYDKDTTLVLADITDNIGVDTAYVEYSVNGAAQKSLGLKLTNGIYVMQFPLTDILGGNKIKYRIVAIDKSKAKNKSFSPATDFYDFSVVKINAVAARYKNDFNSSGSSDFAGSFSVTQPAGFDNPAIHSPHPYKNGVGANSEINYTYQLLTPIKLKADSAKIRFDEVVLVEPGEPGVRFGSPQFYDYVVVEGSVDGYEWFPFTDGYDSNAYKIWLDAFNSATVKDPNVPQALNSTAVGTRALLVSREIDMLRSGDFVAGETVLIRFRLFADELSTGWGWAIDNLQIQVPPPPIVTAVEPKETVELSFGPNPTPDDLLIKTTLNKPGKVMVEVVNMLGAKVLTKDFDNPTTVFNERISTKNLTNGTYILRVFTDNDQKWRRFVVAH